jgi:hypothetical protein
MRKEHGKAVVHSQIDLAGSRAVGTVDCELDPKAMPPANFPDARTAKMVK